MDHNYNKISLWCHQGKRSARKSAFFEKANDLPFFPDRINSASADNNSSVETEPTATVAATGENLRNFSSCSPASMTSIAVVRPTITTSENPRELRQPPPLLLQEDQEKAVAQATPSPDEEPGKPGTFTAMATSYFSVDLIIIRGSSRNEYSSVFIVVAISGYFLSVNFGPLFALVL